jgi:polysaccharide export outer membrane protein
MQLRTVFLLLCGLLALHAGAGAQGYEISSGDVVRIAVVGQPAMSGEFTVDPTGMIDFPVLGRVKATGHTAPALERKLVTLLSEGYLKRPEVAVTVKEFRSHRVFVTGQLAKPGPYALKGDRTLLTLMGEIGPLAADVGHEVIVIRPPDSESSETPVVEAPKGGLPNEVPGSEILRVNLKELLSGNPAKNLELQPADTVYFPKAANIYVTGHVVRSGPIRYEEGMTVFQALTLAGGVTERGSKKVKIIRIVDGRPTEIGAKMTDLLQPEDTIRVPERFF